MAEISSSFIKKFIMALSDAFGLLNRRISTHHKRVTHICLKLSRQLGLSDVDRTTLFYAGLLHDIGAFSSKDQRAIMDFDFTNCFAHCEAGYQILNRVELLKDTAEPIRYHHEHWVVSSSALSPLPKSSSPARRKDDIPLLSQIMHLADRVEVLIDDNKDMVQQSDGIIARIKKHSGIWFNPRIVEAFNEAARFKIFWIALAPEFVDDVLTEFTPQGEGKLSIDSMIEVAYIFAQIVDYKSHHTRDHGTQVTEVAIKLGKALGWSKHDLKRLWIAALLHDLGKLSIPDEILDKASALTANEYAIIKRHPYFSFQILHSIPGFDEISEWLLYHHENLDGTGYPFGVVGENIPPGARIISVADKFVALTEDRPYRPRLPYREAIRVLDGDAKRNAIDPKILALLKEIVFKG